MPTFRLTLPVTSGISLEEEQQHDVFDRLQQQDALS